MADALLDRLKSTTLRIGEIRRAFGTPSVSCGVLHQGEVIFRYAEGFADVEMGRQADADTVYPVASCTKAFISATCAILVREGLLSWDKPVSFYLPEFETPHNPEVGHRATLVDLCSHATGLAPVDNVLVGFHERLYHDGESQVRIASHLPPECGFRSEFLYNNLMYGVVGATIAKVSGRTAGAVMKEKIFQPLGMGRTITSPADDPLDGNVAKGYSVLDKGSLLRLEEPELRDGTANAGAGCVRSTVNNMLKWASAVMQAEMQQSTRNQGYHNLKSNQPEDDEILPGLVFTRAARMPITQGDSSANENAYGMGWFRHTIPSKFLGFTSPNFSLLAEPPIIGKNTPQRLTICHYGAMGGFLAAFYTFPESCSAIVVLGNSSPSRGDPTDLIAQALCQELFDMQPRVSLESFAVLATETSRLIWPALVQEWVLCRGQDADSTAAPVADYVGRYENKGLALQIDVQPNVNRRHRRAGDWKLRNPEPLAFTVNGRPGQRLRRYQGDTWTFLPNSRDDALKKGMERFINLPNLLLVFTRDSDGCITGLMWDLYGQKSEELVMHDSVRVEPVRFEKVA
ncbi:beta-lactamase/transpeptidase-like protein [Apiosordaria backusii]|uniref:Beta-lactamase/transpeptidase-like protein n=1 Tax=Apiosordaria backusii TaxID=314023 RepID=A0AA40ESW3_9PEZI|nr:beta-lactamase/transpeptidase-like protein [Apiosordaria backusii]